MTAVTTVSAVLLGVTASIVTIGSLFKLRALSRAVLRDRRDPERPRDLGARHSFSLLVPAHDEAAVLAGTLERLAGADHPAVQVIAVVDPADRATSAAARSAARSHPDRVTVFPEPPGTMRKPAALNAALPGCAHEIVGVFDADGQVHPGLLRIVDALFTEHELDALQVGIQPAAADPAWYQLHNMVEFRWMFLNGATARPDPRRVVRLSGNSVFLRAGTLRRIGGWNPDHLAEDCELSLRLARDRARTMVWYDAAFATIEEIPGSLGAFVRQRSRWNQGFAQVLRDGGWRPLPWWQRLECLRFLLEAPARALAAGSLLVALPLAPAAPAALPVLLAPLALGAVNTGLLTVLLARLPGRFGVAVRPGAYVSLWAGAPAFQAVLCWAAVRALIRMFRSASDWEKTPHTASVP
ncbi:glycosyltransferase [Streptosporangium sp. NPDC051022]|uniref:glycosyltransferase n=1 Tax=Streptosporangium sp. NPDC051022 TaxID=3155752 RepID=UPI00341430B7